MSGSTGRRLVAIAAVAVAATIAAAIWVIGSPAAQRESRLDARRISDLRGLETAIERHARLHDGLPRGLDVLRDDGGAASRVDPATGTPYGYEPVDDRRYRLCAGFATDSRDVVRQVEPVHDDAWRHPAGRHCFERRLERDAAAEAATAG